MTEPRRRERTSLKAKRRQITFLYHAAIVVVCLGGFITGSVLSNRDMSLFFAFILLVHILTFRLNPLEQFLQEQMIRRAECPACGHMVYLVTLWRCRCGFVMHRPRHAFSPCPNCKKVFQWVDCPYCETSVHI